MRVSRLLRLIAVTIGLSCSSESTDAPPPSTSGGEKISCEADARDIYVANLQKPGGSGLLKFVLAESTPAPPSRGRNTFTLRVLDAASKPIAGAQISLSEFIPAHGHSSPTIPTVTPTGEGYTVGPVSLFMPGLWEVTIEAEASGARDRATFSFCVAG